MKERMMGKNSAERVALRRQKLSNLEEYRIYREDIGHANHNWMGFKV